MGHTVLFRGFSRKQQTSEIMCTFVVNGERVNVLKPDPEAVVSTAVAGEKMAGENEFGMPVPGEILAFEVKTGDKLVAGDPLLTVESMKMETKITVPADLNGVVVKDIVAVLKKNMKLNQIVFSYSK